MAAIDTEKILFWEAHPGSRMRVVGSGKKITMVYATIKPGSVIPEHSHPNEQISYCLQGEATFKIDGRIFHIKKEISFIIPPNAVHSGKIVGNQEYISIEAFAPPRLDLLRGEFSPEKSRE